MIRINLLPPEYRPQPQVRPLRVLALFVIIVAPLAAGGVVVWGLTGLQTMREQIALAKQKRAEYGPLYDKVIGMEATLAEVERKLASRQQLMTGLLDPVGIFKAMEGNVPENVAYTSFSIGADRRISLAGTAADYYGVAALQLKLSLSGGFAQVALQSANASADAVSFSMSCVLSGGTPAP
ncbi:MAG: PilN domain-containing protein [Patescibacteria group bacterium]